MGLIGTATRQYQQHADHMLQAYTLTLQNLTFALQQEHQIIDILMRDLESQCIFAFRAALFLMFFKNTVHMMLQEKRVVALKLATRGVALPGMLAKPSFL